MASIAVAMVTALAWQGVWEGVATRLTYMHGQRIDGLLTGNPALAGTSINIPGITGAYEGGTPCVSSYRGEIAASAFVYTRAVALTNECIGWTYHYINATTNARTTDDEFSKICTNCAVDLLPTYTIHNCSDATFTDCHVDGFECVRRASPCSHCDLTP